MIVAPWSTPLDDKHHRITSAYVELFWTSTLSPTGILFVRRVSSRTRFDHDEMAVELGVAGPQLERTIGRLARFDAVMLDASGETLFVRTHLPDVYEGRRRSWSQRFRQIHQQYLQQIASSGQTARSEVA